MSELQFPDVEARSPHPDLAGTLPGAGLRTQVAVAPEELAAAQALVRRRYAARGYLTETQEARARSGGPVTLLARDHDRLLGTLTVRRDGPQGLFAELSYGAEVNALRAAGHRLGELVQLAVAEDADWKGALDSLVQSAYLVTRVAYCLTDVLIEVNPRHVRFYRRVFGFVDAGALRLCERVRAPSVLLRLDLAQFGQRLRQAA